MAVQFFQTTSEDIILLLMNAIKYMLIYTDINKSNPVGEMHLRISKMSRLFFFSNNKYFSICLPFFVNESDETLMQFYYNDHNIDNQITSMVISIIQDNSLLSNDSDIYNFYSPIDEYSSDDNSIDRILWDIIKGLMLFEDGYIRYDHDPVRCDPVYHPLHHFDLFYTNSVSFKIGLNNRPNNIEFLDLLDINKPCRYIV